MMTQPDNNDYFQRKEWEAQEKRDRYRVAAGMMNFLGVVLGVAAIFLLLALLFSLVSWLLQDVSSTFAILRTRFR
ncbi:MAG: hypothetical protein E7336_05220 [Clostridiales bacterium]|nr:hypothetical protein [Clostridiales bacterium]MDD6683330.1 hypothetical protein [Clostridiales bacterium]